MIHVLARPGSLFTKKTVRVAKKKRMPEVFRAHLGTMPFQDADRCGQKRQKDIPCC